MNNKQALIIFTRNPELGQCKTRLAKTIGDENALKVYFHLLQHTRQAVTRVDVDRYVFYSEKIIQNDMWDADLFQKKIQQGDKLGQRMNHAFEELFNLGYSKVCIIGSDLLDLKQHIMEEAFLKLETHDIVLGPAFDGGYYLLGMKKLHSQVFEKKDWGTSSVLNDTLNDLQRDDVFLLKELNDIDTFEDMKHYDELKKYLD